MNHFKKLVLSTLSYPYFNLKKYYKVYRKIRNILNPYFKPIYHALDHKIMIEDREIPVRIFPAKKQAIPKILIFFHGGGWVTGNIDSYTSICANMAKETRHTIVSVDYRLAPENPFPAGAEDCYHVTKEILLNPDLVHCKQTDITLIGDSAGGNLAAVISQMGRDRGEFIPGKQILIYPATYHDHSESAPFPSIKENGTDYILTAKRVQDYMDLYVKNKEDKYHPYVAPLLAQDLSHQPKTLILTAEFDPLRDEGEAYGMKLREFGNEVKIHRIKGALHGFFTLPWKSEAMVECYDKINDFLKDQSDWCEDQK